MGALHGSSFTPSPSTLEKSEEQSSHAIHAQSLDGRPGNPLRKIAMVVGTRLVSGRASSFHDMVFHWKPESLVLMPN